MLNLDSGDLWTGAAIVAGKEIHDWIGGPRKAKQQLILDRKEYCPPVMSLPNDTPEWKILLYKDQCKGLEVYLTTKAPEKKPRKKTAPELIGPPAP